MRSYREGAGGARIWPGCSGGPAPSGGEIQGSPLAARAGAGEEVLQGVGRLAALGGGALLLVVWKEAAGAGRVVDAVGAVG